MGRVPAHPPNVASPVKSPKRLKPDIHYVVFGNVLFPTWYLSFYPDALVGKELDRLHVCQWCFKYTDDQARYLSHTVRHSSLSTGLSILLTDTNRSSVTSDQKAYQVD